MGVMGIDSNLLEELAEAEGYETVTALLEHDVYDSVCAAICTDPACRAITVMEPDQDRGYCEECGKNTVKSSLVLAGIL